MQKFFQICLMTDVADWCTKSHLKLHQTNKHRTKNTFKVRDLSWETPKKTNSSLQLLPRNAALNLCLVGNWDGNWGVGRGEGEGNWHLRFNKGLTAAWKGDIYSQHPGERFLARWRISVHPGTHSFNGEEFWKANQSGSESTSHPETAISSNLRGVHLDMSTPLMIQSKESSE